MYGFFACLYDCTMFVQCSQRRVLGPLGLTGGTGDCESPRGCWEVNPGPLEERSVLLNPEPSLQPQISLV